MDINSMFVNNGAINPDGDKRSDARVPVPLIPVIVGEESEPLTCVMLNISRTGALIQAPKTLDAQSVIKTNFVLPRTETPVGCRSRVVWSRNVYNLHTRLGIRFDDIDPASSEAIQTYVHDQIKPRNEHKARVQQRVPTPYLSVVIGDGRGHSNGIILDISRSGLLVQSKKKINTGSVVSAEFTLPGTDKAVRCLAKVAWRKHLYGVLANEGLEFIDISAEDLKNIDEFVGKQQLPQA